MSWTDERVELLKKMWGEGQSASQIAKELGGVTRNAVIGKVHRLGLSNRNAGASAASAPAAAAEPKPAPKPKAEAKPKPAPKPEPLLSQDDLKIAAIIKEFSDGQGRLSVSTLSEYMIKAHSIQIKSLPAKNWSTYLKNHPQIYTVTGKGATLSVQLTKAARAATGT